MDSIETRLRALEDYIALHAIIAAYGPAVDTPDGAAVAAAYVEQGQYLAGDFAFVGLPAIQGLVDIATHQSYLAQGCAHVLSPHRITIDGDTATAQGHSVVFVRGDGGWTAERVSANQWRFVRTPQGWKVAQRVNRLLDGSAAARALLAPYPTDQAPSATIT